MFSTVPAIWESLVCSSGPGSDLDLFAHLADLHLTTATDLGRYVVFFLCLFFFGLISGSLILTCCWRLRPGQLPDRAGR
jgi:hypothetical protein